ncbi:MAG: cation:proton antiporter [Nanohaloarchaea archaeon]|nr:cation:proton antiporter [Candidatus Nanohaloarchaea archaeon]
MSELITILTAVFVASSIMIFLLEKLSHPRIPAYILAGIFVGTFINQSEILGLSQLGIAFLVFVFGIKSDLGRIRAVGEESVSTALIQIFVVGTMLFLVAKGIGFSLSDSLYFSLAGALSSSLVGLELVKSEVRVDILHGRLAEAIQLFQDLVAVIAITIILSGFTVESIGLNLSYLCVTILGALIIRQILMDKVARLAEGSRELITLFSLSVLILFISTSQYINSSLVVGSFAAGLAVSKFPHNMEILDTMGSMKDFFSSIFFVTLGALIAVPTFETLILTAVLTSTTLLLKPVMTGVALLINGYDRRTAYLTGLSLDQTSEFALIIAIQAHIAGTIDPAIFQSIILSATLTMIVSSYTSRYEEELYNYVSNLQLVEVNSRKINEKTSLPEKLEDHVILLGFDTQGREIAEALRQEDQSFVLIENDPEKIEEFSKKHDNYIFGDVMDEETWKKASSRSAKMVISTIPFRRISKKILDLETDADKILRAQSTLEARELLEDGALYVNVPDILSSEELVEHVNGVIEDRHYREELRRRNLLEIRRYLQEHE